MAMSLGPGASLSVACILVTCGLPASGKSMLAAARCAVIVDDTFHRRHDRAAFRPSGKTERAHCRFEGAESGPGGVRAAVVPHRQPTEAMVRHSTCSRRALLCRASGPASHELFACVASPSPR